MKCPNCGNEHTGEFCNLCGQSNVDLHTPAAELAHEAFEEAFGFDSRLRHTLKPFFLQPGELTRDYLAGRRVRYTSPLKLYLIASVLFFFAAAQGGASKFVHIDSTSQDSQTTAVAEGLAQGIKEAAPAPGAAKKPHSRFGQLVEGKLQALSGKGNAEASRELSGVMLNLLPKAMFVLVPLFAWLLKKLWSRRFYAEHLVFALHFHAFVMLSMLPSTFVTGRADELLSSIALAISAIYLFLALRRVYGDGLVRTLAKLLGLGVCYSILLGLAMALVAIASLLML